MDVEDEEDFRLEIVRIELRKINKLLKRHRSRIVELGLGDGGMGDSECYRSRMYESVIAFMEAKVRTLGTGLRKESDSDP